MAANPNVFNVRPDDETQALVEALKEKLGIGNTPLFKVMVRTLAEKEKVKPKPPAKAK